MPVPRLLQRVPSSLSEDQRDERSIGADGTSDARINLPNAITLSGYAATIAWLMGASPWWAVAGLVADEADGRVARATNETSEFGSLLDWGVDLTLTGVVMERSNILPLLPVVTTGQVYLRQKGYRPPIGSARAVATIYTLWKSKFKPLK